MPVSWQNLKFWDYLVQRALSIRAAAELNWGFSHALDLIQCIVDHLSDKMITWGKRHPPSPKQVNKYVNKQVNKQDVRAPHITSTVLYSLPQLIDCMATAKNLLCPGPSVSGGSCTNVFAITTVHQTKLALLCTYKTEVTACSNMKE